MSNTRLDKLAPNTRLTEGEKLQLPFYPSVSKDIPISKHNQITIGPLHANALKLIHLLILSKVLELKEGAQDYQKLLDIYYKDFIDLSETDFEDFDKILNDAKINSIATVRLLGGVLAGSGRNDYFTLKVLEKLAKNDVPVEILFSTRDIPFIEAYELNQNLTPLELGEKAISMHNLRDCIEEEMVSEKKVYSLINKYYKPALRFLSYTSLPGPDDQPDKLTIYSQSAYALSEIPGITNDATRESITAAIDEVNLTFLKLVMSNTVSNTFKKSKGKIHESRKDSLSSLPNHDKGKERILDGDESEPSASEEKKPVEVDFVFSYDRSKRVSTSKPDQNFKLNSEFGNCKDRSDTNNRAWLSDVLFSQESPAPTLNLHPSQFAAFSQLSVSIQSLLDYAIKLEDDNKKPQDTVVSASVNTAKGLVKELNREADNFLREYLSKVISPEEAEGHVQEFTRKMNETLTSAQKDLSKHRQRWKRYLANIGIALTGVGALFILGNAFYKGHWCLLFPKTQRQKLAEKIKASVLTLGTTATKRPKRSAE